LNNFVDNFSTLIKRTNQNDIFETDEIAANINEFLTSLKQKNKEQFAKCSKDLFLWALRNIKSLNEERLAKLKLIFNSLDQEDFGALLWEGLGQEDNFDILNLELFSKISEQKDPSQIAEAFSKKINASQYLNNNPKAVKRIKDLLAETQTDQISAVYRNTLEALIKGVSFSGVLFFDQRELRENYRYILLNMLSIDEDKDNLLLAAEILEKELVDILENNDLGFLKDFRDLLVKRKKEGNSVCVDLERKLSVSIENIILNQSLASEREFFLEMVSFPSREMNFYLDKIFIPSEVSARAAGILTGFAAEKANKHILSLFLKFFPEGLDIFYLKVEQRLQDLEFLASLIDALAQLNTPVTLGILDHIYSSANELIKIKILSIMRKLKKVDVQFLLRQLNTNSPLLRKSLFSVLILDAQAGDGAIDLLLKIPSFCGSKNGLLIENMQIVFDLGLIEAAGRIHDLSLRRFLWNRKLRDKAKQILKEWNVH
jgi:hypothetical protein